MVLIVSLIIQVPVLLYCKLCVYSLSPIKNFEQKTIFMYVFSDVLDNYDCI